MSIGRAVDVAQIISRKTENSGYMIGNISIGSESLESQDGKTRNVSTIEIEVKRWADMGHVEGIWGHTEEFEQILVAFFSKNLG